MIYDMPLYRPPSEAHSLIFQVSLGCSYNKCKFCLMYRAKRFKARPFDDIRADIEEMAREFPHVGRVFLADGDAVACKTDFLVDVLRLIKSKFPRLERITSYASPQNLQRKTVAELKTLREEGLDILYFGIETGDEELLKKIDKGVTHDEIVESALKARKTGFPLSATVILGLGGKSGSKRHIAETARILNEIQPEYVGALTLMLGPLEDWYAKQMGPDWEWLDKMELLGEIRDLISQLDLKNSVFRSNHASNYLALKGNLNRDRNRLLKIIDAALSDPNSPLLRPEEWRAL